MNLTIPHLQEWLSSAPAYLHESAEKLARLNVVSLEGDLPLEFLAVGLPYSERRNDGRLRDKWLNRYSHTQAGGWWVSGLDPLNNWEPMVWGRFKPDKPRNDWDKEKGCYKDKLVKYESPPQTSNRVTYLRVTPEVWERVATRYNLPMPENLTTTSESEALGFWRWVIEHPEIPIVLTEGEKKAFSLLSLGFVAVALPGIWTGCIKDGDSFSLHPDLMPLAHKGRKLVVLFDYEAKPETREKVFYATLRLGTCIERAGCLCEVALLPGEEKGVDDWLVAWGKKANQAASALIADAWSFKNYRCSYFGNKKRGLRKYTPNVILDTHYLSDAIKLPQSGLVGIRSDVSTGKTKLMVDWRKENPTERFLNNGHRVNLLRNLAKRLHTEMYSAVGAGGLSGVTALSITADSLYKMANNLQAYGCIFIDEACQYLTHLLMSKTLKKHRAEILEVLEHLIYTAKLVVLADAHLDDVTIEFFQAMRPEGEQPFIIQNDWKAGGRQTYYYSGKNPSALVAQIHAALLQGEKVIVVADSKRFIKKLERSLQTPLKKAEAQTVDEIIEEELEEEADQDRQLRIWSIHSENSGSPENQAFIEDITNSVKAVDALLCSPSLGTGVDICGNQGEYHFDVIFGAFHATTAAATDCIQQLWRYRPNVPMHIWVAPRPPFGYADCNAWKIKQQILGKNEMTAFLIRIDRETGKRGAEKDYALEALCQIQAQRNWSINNLRQDLRSLLEEMGNPISLVGGTDEQAKELMKTSGEQLDEEHCQLVASADEIDRRTYESRQNKDYLDPKKELPEYEKFRIRDTYGMDVTSELVKLDDGGRLIGRLMALEGILAEPGEVITDEQGRSFTTPPTIVRDRDLTDREWLQISTDWRNESAGWLTLYRLGLRDILFSLIQGDALCGEDPVMQAFLEKARKSAPHIKAILNITIPSDASATWVLGTLLNRLALSTVSTRKRVEGECKRFYSLKEEELAFALQVLNYRQQQREEKERKRQEQQAKNAAHAAWIQSQYGSKPQPEAATPDEIISQEVEQEVNYAISEQLIEQPINQANQVLAACAACMETLEALEADPEAIASEDELIEVFRGVERQSTQCLEQLPEDFWERLSTAVGVCSDVLQQRETRLESAVRLLKEAISYGAETVYCVLRRWKLEQRWEAILRLEKVSSEAMERLVSVAPDWSAAMCDT